LRKIFPRPEIFPRPARPAPATATPRGRRALIRSQPLTSREHPF